MNEKNGVISNRVVGSKDGARIAVLDWRAFEDEGADVLRVNLGPINLLNKQPYGTGQIEPGQTAGITLQTGSFSGGLDGVTANQPVVARWYAVVRWGIETVTEELLADWPYHGGGFDLLCDSLQVYAVSRGTTAGNIAQLALTELAASVSVGARGQSGLEPLTLQQTVNASFAVGPNWLSVPRHAHRLVVHPHSGTSTSGMLQFYRVVNGTTNYEVVAQYSFTPPAPIDVPVPASAQVARISLVDNAVTVSCVWSVAP